MNSLDPEPDGEMLISARNTWALYQLDEQTGQVLTARAASTARSRWARER